MVKSELFREPTNLPKKLYKAAVTTVFYLGDVIVPQKLRKHLVTTGLFIQE
jgi:hypothetical protein